VELEKRGIPVATICTDEFFELGKAEADYLGMPGLPIVAIPHPMAGRSAESVGEVADQAFAEIEHALTADAGSLAAEYRGKTLPSASRSKLRYRPVFGDGPGISEAGDRLKAPESLEGINTLFYVRGWTDGLPIIPPTEARFDRMISHSGLDPDLFVGAVAPKRGAATIGKIAVNAIMAGCRPEHLPVVVAATKAMVQEPFNLAALQSTTHPCTVLVLVNGPLVRELNFNCSYNAMGQGSLSNAVIGRAIRLILINIGGASPGVLDRATLGSPAKYSFCFGENEEESPWEPFHVERGFGKNASTVTVIGAEGPHNVNDHGSITAEGILMTISGVLATTGSNNLYLGGEPIVVLGPEHAGVIARCGFSKQDIRDFLFESARIPVAAISTGNLDRFKRTNPERFVKLGSEDRVPLVERPEEIMVVVAGGKGRHSMVIPTFGGHTRAITVPITDGGG
jgi:hypothetical protein